jgi:hypothetical protein
MVQDLTSEPNGSNEACEENIPRFCGNNSFITVFRKSPI